MKFKQTVVSKKYLIFSLFALFALTVFFFLEKNSHSYSIVLNDSNELSDKSIKILQQLSKDTPILFEVFTNENSPIAKKIKQYFIPYQRQSENIFIKFLDPLTHPSEVKINAVTIQGEMVLGFVNGGQNRKVNITELSESSIVNAVNTLFNQKDEWIVLAESFGMPTINDDTNQGLSQMLIALKKLGYNVARMPLTIANVLPDNVKVIILPAPSKPLGIEIVDWLNSQTDKGISLWWLSDVELNSQSNLELALDVLISGKINLNDEEDTGYISTFAKHPITENFNQPIFVAQSQEIIADGFDSLFINSENKVFSVTKTLKKSRLVISGDADFIRNQYINVAANKAMMIRIVDWLLHRDDRINVAVKVNKNTQLLLSQKQLIGLSLFFLIIVPIIFLFIALVQWKKNK